MQIENTYIGDEKFKRFLEHYKCPSDIETVKLKFAGAICSPNNDLRPTDVISSFFRDNQQPRLETKSEAELFFKFFMGLWDEMFFVVKANKLKLPKAKKASKEDLIALCEERSKQIEFGFVEGFWGGLDTLNIPNFTAELINSLSDMADAYYLLAQKLTKSNDNDDIYLIIVNMDEKVEETISFLINYFVLPRIDNIQRTVN